MAINRFWLDHFVDTHEMVKPKANQTHFDVGKKVRQTIQELGGDMPENLPTEESIKKVKKIQSPKTRLK